MHYPFKSFDGQVTFERQRSGERRFDFTKDGVAHYGLFPDWWEDIRSAGGAATVRDMAAGPRPTCRSGSACTASGIGCKSRPQADHAPRLWRTCGSATRAAQLLRRARPAEGPRQLRLELVRARKEEPPPEARGGAHAAAARWRSCARTP